MTDQSAVVVLEPTDAMLKAGRDAAQSAHAHSLGWTDEARSVWSAMIAAAPKPTLSGEARLRDALPDLSAVIGWLENGCEVSHAVTELRIHQKRIVAALSSPLPGEE